MKHSSKLITNACAFIAVIVAELSYQSAGTVVSGCLILYKKIFSTEKFMNFVEWNLKFSL